MRKLVVLEPQVYEKLKPRQNVEERILSDLDQQMNKILTSTLSEHEKVKLYNEALQKSRFFEKKRRPQKTKEKPIPESTLLKGYKKPAHARRVLRAVRENRSSGWNEKGNLMIDGEAIPNSDIKKLLHSTLHRADETLPGWNEFTSVRQWKSL